MFSDQLDAPELIPEPELTDALDALAEVLEHLEASDLLTPEVPDTLVQLSKLRARLDGATLAVLARFDTDRLHDLDGLGSTRTWAKHHLRASSTGITRHLRLARRLHTLPVTADALRDGRITLDALETICRAWTPERDPAFRDDDPLFASWAENLHPDDLAIAMGHWANAADPDGTDPDRRHRTRSVHLNQGINGTWNLNGTLTDELGARLDAELDRRARRLRTERPDATTTPAQLRHDALEDLLTHPTGTRQRDTTRLVITIPADDLRLGLGATTTHGHHLDGATVATIACDTAVSNAFVDAAGNLLHRYSDRREPDHHLRAAIAALWPTCAVPGCDVPSHRCDLHHLREWHLGGRTEPDNLLPLCPHHHHALHRHRWTITGHPHHRIQIHRPGRTPLTATSRWRPTTPPRAGPTPG